MDPILDSAVNVGDGGVVLDAAPSGLPVIALPSPLTALHYFDGQAMREQFLAVEQRYQRSLAALAARAGGYGVASGLDVESSGGDKLRIGAGLAVDGLGRVLQLPAARVLSMADLVAASRTVAPAMDERLSISPEFLRCVKRWTARPVSARDPVALWVIVASWSEETGATRTGSVTREGLRVRAVPLALRTPVAASHAIRLDPWTHTRSLVASSIFADEWARGESLISAEGLGRGAWCLGAQLDDRREVPLAVVARTGGEILFVDQWIVRRERHESPPARHWSGVMRMRSRSAYLAQVLQFQCQLADASLSAGIPRSQGCDDARVAIIGAADYLSNLLELWQPDAVVAAEAITPQQEYEGAVLRQSGGATRLMTLARTTLTAVHEVQRLPRDRLLIRHGIVELPPAGYLPVSVGNEQDTVNAQVQALMGEGVDVRCCVVHPDAVGAELDAGQHMERVSLLEGIDDPARKPRVDVFVPDGVVVAPPAPTDRFEASLRLATASLGSGLFGGAARREALDGGGAALHVALSSVVAALVGLLTRTDAARLATDDALWFTLRTDRSIQSLQPTEIAHLSGRAVLAGPGSAPAGRELTLDGQLTMRSSVAIAGRGRIATATIAATIALAQRSHDDAGDSASLLSRRVNLTLEMHFSGSDATGSMTARLLADTAGGARLATPVPLATIQKDWGTPAGQTTVAFLAFSALVDLFTLPGTIGATGPMTIESAPDTRATGEVPEQFAVLELIENGDVDRVDHPLHRLANAGVRTVQALLDTETTFARDALAALFPPPASPGLLVRATRDWVVFRRRRDARFIPWTDGRTAGIRRMRVLAVAMPSVDAARRLVVALRAPNTPLGALLDGAGRDVSAASPVYAEFARESARLLSDPGELRDAIAALDPGTTLVAAIIASSRDDGPELLVRRLRTLLPALAPSVVGDSAVVLALPAPPPDLVTLDADGIMLLVTT